MSADGRHRGTDRASDGDLRTWATGRDWYHTLELAPGVETAGWFDTRPLAQQLPWPSLTGKRCLDVGTFDGFWAFEMERRGASEVVAVDVPDPAAWDWPAGSTAAAHEEIAKRKGKDEGFVIARRALQSSVDRRALSVYELGPEKLGRFDFVYLGSLLVHLRDPVAALTAVRSVCSGTLMLVDAVDPWASLASRRPVARLDGNGRPWWWLGNRAALVRMVEAAGFEVLGTPSRHWIRAGASQRAMVKLAPDQRWPPPSEMLRLVRQFGGSVAGRELLLRLLVGDPHVCITARPR